eukprot:COSAG01_NODE_68433_length_264_cov_0.624242_1_plen_60_part_01
MEVESRPKFNFKIQKVSVADKFRRSADLPNFRIALAFTSAIFIEFCRRNIPPAVVSPRHL